MKRKEKQASKSPKDTAKRNRIVSVCIFVVGVIALIVGVVFLVLNLLKGDALQDGEYLVSANNWVLENEPGVVWDFTEIGKGTLTTNGHIDDYDFVWALEDNKLKIETNWLYDIDNEYEYDLNQGAGTLVLTDEDGSYTFVADFESE